MSQSSRIIVSSFVALAAHGFTDCMPDQIDRNPTCRSKFNAALRSEIMHSSSTISPVTIEVVHQRHVSNGMNS